MKWKVVLEKLKKVKPTRLIILLFFVISNTFAWFIYATKVDTDVTVHVRSWNVVFQAGENEVTDTVNLNVDSIYPGMTDYLYEITAYNHSEVNASLSYVLLEANILGQEYVTVDGRIERGEAAVATDISSGSLESILANNYPFTITLGTTNSTIQLGTGSEQFQFSVVWPYEQNDDATDTYWGIRAADYKTAYPALPSITIKAKIIITQNLS